MRDCWLAEPGLRPSFSELAEKIASVLSAGSKGVCWSLKCFGRKKTYVGRCIFSSMVRWPFLPSSVPPPPRYPGEGTPQCKTFGTFVWDNYLLKIKSTPRGVRTNYFQWSCHEIFFLQGTSALANKISWIGLKYVGCTGNNQQLIDGAKKRSSCLTIQQLFLFLVTDYLNNILK